MPFLVVTPRTTSFALGLISSRWQVGCVCRRTQSLHKQRSRLTDSVFCDLELTLNVTP